MSKLYAQQQKKEAAAQDQDSDEERTADLAALCQMFPNADSEEIETLLWTEDRKGVEVCCLTDFGKQYFELFLTDL